MTYGKNNNLHEEFPNLEHLLSDRLLWEAVIEHDLRTVLAAETAEASPPSPAEQRRFALILQAHTSAQSPLPHDAEEV